VTDDVSDDYVLAPSATLAAAQRVIAAALHEADVLSLAVCIAVSDGAGHLLAMVRMDRAPLMHPDRPGQGVFGRRLRWTSDG